MHVSYCRFLNPKAEYAKDAIDSLVKLMFEMLFASADNVATQVCCSAVSCLLATPEGVKCSNSSSGHQTWACLLGHFSA